VTAGRQRVVAVVVVAGLSLWAMAMAATRAWVCDDAFITLRCAENLANGLGAVYNAGERVEGYSNPSWLVFAALAIRLGLDPVAFVQWLGILCLGALVPVTFLAGRRLIPGDAGFLPLAALGVALHTHLADFASCGLETLGFVLLVTLVFLVLARAERPGQWALASLLAVLAALTRPDGAVIGALAGLLALGAGLRARRLAPVLAFALPGLLLFVPFLLWRHAYYGDWLPNTFYAKSAHDPYAAQGWFYVRLFFDAYWVLWPAFVSLPAMLFLRRRGGAMPVLAVLTLGYLAFVIWVGGDFMFARFCLPVTPLCYLGLEALTRRYVAGAARWLVVVLVGLGTMLYQQRADLAVVGATVQGVADERAQYPPERVAALRAVGRRLGGLLAGTDARVAFSGTQAMLVYDAKFAYALEAVTGLTDRWLARRPLAARGQPGHEKAVRFENDEDRRYVVATQRVQLLLVELPLVEAFPWLRVTVDGFAFTLLRWDRAVMARLLAQPGVVATDLDRYVEDLAGGRHGKPKAVVAQELRALDQVYFPWCDAGACRARIVAWLAR
jgi:hypothetical protein